MAAVGAATIIEAKSVSKFKRIEWDWTSSAGGAVSGILTIFGFFGKIVSMTTIPAGGGVAPTAYTVKILNPDQVDIMQGLGARSTTLTEVVAPTVPYIAYGQLEMQIASAGNAKQGTVILYIDDSGDEISNP